MKTEIKVDLSNRHVHLSEEDLRVLFGEGAELTVKRMLGKAEFAANETLAVSGPRGRLDGVRIIGPCRKTTQAELLAGDCRRLGIDAPVCESAAEDAAEVTLTGPAGSLTKDAAIIAHRHVHLNAEVGESMGLKEGQLVKVRVGGVRGLVFENVLVRLHKGPLCVVHLDAEEGNAALCASGDTVELFTEQ